jgi:hypothetical protein
MKKLIETNLKLGKKLKDKKHKDRQMMFWAICYVAFYLPISEANQCT